MITTAKFPGTAGVSALALADVGGEMSGIPFNEWTANGATTAGAATPFSLVSNEAIDTSVPTQGWLTTANGEVLHYSTYVAGTKTFTIDARAQFGTVAAAIDSGSAFGQWLNKQQWNQIVAEIIAMQTKLLVGDSPNLISNGDFGRATTYGLAMPEAFTDTTGATAVDGSLGAVASNVLTAGTNGTWSIKWCGTNATFYRDARFSFLVKQNGTGTTNVGRIGGGKGDGVGAWTANNGVYAVYFRTGASTVTLELIKVVAGVTTVVASQAGVTWTDGRVGWAEVEGQGTTYTARFYDQGSGTPGVKSAATRLDNGAITGTIADAGVVSGQPMAVNGSGVGVATVWGGVSTVNGGVYVETWLPDSWSIAFSGTLGGQAIGYDDSADSGPLARQSAMRVYCPAATRNVSLQGYVDSSSANVGRGSVNPSTAYTSSMYRKVTGVGQPGVSFGLFFRAMDQSVTSSSTITDAAAATWTRITQTNTSDATTRTASVLITLGGVGAGIAYFMLPQLEQGSAATAWRNAPADDAPVVWRFLRAASFTTTSAVAVPMDTRDLAGNLRIPWDARVEVKIGTEAQNSSLSQRSILYAYVDGAVMDSVSGGLATAHSHVVNLDLYISGFDIISLAAGKHRIEARASTGGGTAVFGTGTYSRMTVTAYRGK